MTHSNIYISIISSLNHHDVWNIYSCIHIYRYKLISICYNNNFIKVTFIWLKSLEQYEKIFCLMFNILFTTKYVFFKLYTSILFTTKTVFLKLSNHICETGNLGKLADMYRQQLYRKL